MPSLERLEEPSRPSERDDEPLFALRLELLEPDEALKPRSLELEELEPRSLELEELDVEPWFEAL